MKGNVFWIVAAAGLALMGCNKAESPAEVQNLPPRCSMT